MNFPDLTDETKQIILDTLKAVRKVPYVYIGKSHEIKYLPNKLPVLFCIHADNIRIHTSASIRGLMDLWAINPCKYVLAPDCYVFTPAASSMDRTGTYETKKRIKL